MRKFLPLIMLILAGCTKPASISNLTVSGAELGYKGGVVTISFSTNRSWSAGTATGWSAVSSRSGDAGDITLSVAVSESFETEVRSVDVVLKAEDASEKVRIVQEGRPTVEPDTKTCRLGSEGGYYTLELRSNVSYTVEVPASATWIRCISTKAMVTHKAEFAFDPNTSTTARKAEAVLRGGADEQIVTFIQDGAAQVLVIVHNSTDFTFPTLDGNDVSGTVDWGYGGYTDQYKPGLGFPYLDVAQRTVTFKGRNATGVTVSDVSDILKLDLSGL